MTAASSPPTALLFISPGCPHCPAVIEGLTQLIKKGKLAHLEIVNIAADPAPARELGVRSVPWFRIGALEFEGAHTPVELERWSDLAAGGGGLGEYYTHSLEHRRLEQVSARIDAAPATVTDLLGLLETADIIPLAALIGVGAVMEELSPDHPAWEYALPALRQLSQAEKPQTRVDACHYLGLSGRPEAAAAVRRLLDDPDAEVREVAAESLALLDPEGSARN